MSASLAALRPPALEESQPAVNVYAIDPLQDPRWRRFVEENHDASVFHSPEWLEALRRTYGYQPLVITTSDPGRDLVNGLVICRISSGITGRRLVSLPFSDHCEPLVNRAEDLSNLIESLKKDAAKNDCRYIEIRPESTHLKDYAGFEKTREYWYHRIDLGPNLPELFRRFHPSCVQRKIRRAEREGLTFEAGRSESLLSKFYNLLLLTRRRQRLPPQPLSWFRNLIACLGEKAMIRVAAKRGQSIAAILTLRHGDVLVYKYGCSDTLQSRLGGMPFLFWQLVQEAKQQRIRVLDLGRSDRDNHGLVAFKDRLGAARSTIAYWTYPNGISGKVPASWAVGVGKALLGHMPDSWLATTGKLLYRHLG
jgi:lipid II:glycine glycyltransferase (peptidoglycan interpeptide bridge formation enzyme)